MNADGAERIAEELCGFEARLAGTDAERRAANHVASELRKGGRRATVEPIHVHPQWAVARMLHAVAGVAGSLVAPAEPAVGFAIVLVAATSLYLDLSARHYLVRRLFFRRSSQNVVSEGEDSDERPRVVLCANVDAPRTGAAYNRGPQRAFGLLRRGPLPFSAEAFAFWALALLLPVIGARMAGLDEAWLALFQLPQTLTLILAAFLWGEISLSPPSPGANGNASGVAAALRAAAALDADPPENLGVDVALTGGGECGHQGIRSFLRSRRKRRERTRTFFVAFDAVGTGDPRYLRSGSLALTHPSDPLLVELAAALAEGDESFGALRAGPASEATVAAAYGHRALTISARRGAELLPVPRNASDDVPDRLRGESIEAAAKLGAALVRLLDRELGREGSPARD
jgi:hypothetical protein